MEQSKINTYIKICKTYDTNRKDVFARLGKQIAKEIATLLNLPKDTYEIRYNKAGPAVLGDVILHSDNVYIELSPSVTGPWFYFRECKGKKDYHGGRNINCESVELLDLPKFVSKIRKHIPHFSPENPTN